eukprot:TRINITY_DN528661_c0_g1_i1.p1 TRINITY_DN528661_c0_g1~~TRINITY_DN528661_c0_g1_i1.p1  ORF type:complete len:153 (+),score=26.51 TRINITY_DN528661_c0_g1_i1:58-516(+)
MGNTKSSGSNIMAITAMSHTTNFDRDELKELQVAFRALCSKRGNQFTVTRAEFSEVLATVGIDESDKVILDRLFTLFDTSGDGQINFRDFIVGMSTLIRGDVTEKLNFAFEMFDLDGSERIQKDEMLHVFSNMNNTISFFGDAKIGEDEIAR